MSGLRKTAIVTGASQGIGAGIVHGLVARGFNGVANSRKVTQSTEVAAFNHVALVDGHIGAPATAACDQEGMHAAHEGNGPRFAHALLTTEELLALLPS